MNRRVAIRGRRRALMLLLLAALMTVAFGCTSDDAGSGDESDPASADTETPTDSNDGGSGEADTG